MAGDSYLGIDVGTGSARAGVFDATGALLASAKQDIRTWREPGGIAEQSSENIWAAVVKVVREAVGEADAAGSIAGIGFDATCSLVVLDRDDRPLSISTSGDPARNIILWMDQRATDQAAQINARGHAVLDFVGGRISPEMETPKLLWLKENMPETYGSARYFFDLTDFLTWQATGDTARSLCTVACKWTYLAHEGRWDPSYFQDTGLGDLADDNFARIGTVIVPPGTPIGQGLSAVAAKAFGLQAGIPVAAGLIDAHAGGVGTIGAIGASPQSRMAYVFGTSACTMTSTADRTAVSGVWGPYYSAMVPGLWLLEGGQSAAGEAIAHVVDMHPHSFETRALAQASGQSSADFLMAHVTKTWWDANRAIRAADPLLVVPDFLGNRAPFADPSARGIIAGMDLRRDLDSHALLYVGAIVGVGYGLRQILDAQAEAGVTPDTVVLSGGAGRSPLLRQLLADAAGLPIAEAGSPEPVLLGSAMLGAVAAGHHDTLTQAMAGMSTLGDITLPGGGDLAVLHDERYARFKALQGAARQG